MLKIFFRSRRVALPLTLSDCFHKKRKKMCEVCLSALAVKPNLYKTTTDSIVPNRLETPSLQQSPTDNKSSKHRPSWLLCTSSGGALPLSGNGHHIWPWRNKDSIITPGTSNFRKHTLRTGVILPLYQHQPSSHVGPNMQNSLQNERRVG